ncbi:MAG: hypothetical protein FWD74_04385 [Actinomycetia bacterium]|nr:hypothetical protein [Actinomycetes bacterium]
MIQIDIDADLNMVDDDDRNLAPRPTDMTGLSVGAVVVAGRPGAWSWVRVDEITKTAVFFRQLSVREAESHGELALAAAR